MIPVDVPLEETVTIKDSAGATISASGYAVNYDAKRVTFTANQNGQPRYIDLNTYNIYRAAANVWLQKAAFVSPNYDFKTDNHDLKASQEYEMCMKQAERFAKLAGSSIGRFVRVDENGDLYATWNGEIVQPSNVRPSRSLP
jgi:hypothetical protein